MRFMALCLALAAAPLPAQTLTGAEADTLPRLIASLCLDIHEATGCEQILLLENVAEADTADLIVLSDRRTGTGSNPLLIVREIAYNGAMWGMSPSLETGGNGTFRLNSEQIGIGRHPWSQQLQIGWRDGAFQVLAFAYSTYDRLGAGSFSCDVDFAARRYQTQISMTDPESEEEITEETGGLAELAPVPLAEWQAFRPLPEVCGLEWDRFHAAQP